jgi:transposase InsO family protein
VLAAHIQGVFQASRQTYGSPQVHARLRADGVWVGRKRVTRLMQDAALAGRGRGRPRLRTTESRHDQPVAPNHLAWQCTVAAPDRAWVTDITYLPTQEGWL